MDVHDYPIIDELVDDGVFHYDQAHESLEDEIFELHTQGNKDDLAAEGLMLGDDRRAAYDDELIGERADKSKQVEGVNSPPKSSSSQKHVIVES